MKRIHDSLQRVFQRTVFWIFRNECVATNDKD